MSTQITTTPVVYVEAPTASNNLLSLLAAMEADMNTVIIEGKERVRAMFCAILAQQHCLLLGDPGTGKSTAVNEFAARIVGETVNVAKLLVTRYTDPAEGFGPFSIPALQQGRYERVPGPFATAHLLFLDEVMKGNPVFLNTLLTLMEEREIDTANGRIKVPLMSLFGASNELPNDDSLHAFRDRFGVAMMVKRLSPAGRRKLLDMQLDWDLNGKPAPAATLTMVELQAAIEMRRTITVPNDVRQLLAVTLAVQMVDEGITVRDRRMAPAVKMMQANAMLSGRTEVTRADFSILRHVLWTMEDEIDKVAKLLNDLNDRGKQAHALVTPVGDVLMQLIQDWYTLPDDVRIERAMQALGAAKAVQREIATIKAQAEVDGADTTNIQMAADAVKAHQAEITKLLVG